jgi:Protein of unknown function (DUF1236)
MPMKTDVAPVNRWALALVALLAYGPIASKAQNLKTDLPSSLKGADREDGQAGASSGSDASVKASPGEPGPQSTSDAPHDVPNLGLSPSQKQTIYESIRNQQVKKSAQPIGFRSAVGSHVPDALEVAPLPKTIVELMPKLTDYQFAFVANEVLIVDPKSKMVVEVISQ